MATATATTTTTTTTAILCGSTECNVDNLRHQLANCSHRLHWAATPPGGIRGGGRGDHAHRLLPGGGQTEAAVISMLERAAISSDAEETFRSSNAPLYLSRSWMGSKYVLDEGKFRAPIYQAFANGLRKYVTRSLMNAMPGLGQYEARSRVEAMIQTGGTKNNDTGLESIEENQLKQEKKTEVMDVATSKIEAWKKAIRLLETIFLIRKVNAIDHNQ